MSSQLLSAWLVHDRIIKRWLEGRQVSLVTFHTLCQHRPFQASDPALFPSLQTFCASLIDYLAWGHFKVFEKIVFVIEGECHGGVKKSLISALERTAVALLDFHDSLQEKTSQLEADLNGIGEQMAKRFMLEDELIKIYLAARECYSSKYCNLPLTPFHFSASGKASL